ncbi:MAG: hypothetical protein MJ223_03005 [Mycoplasmoidaceae bacterium]|nr:hypothetical protein [Mycoplasmoidaceae bacterium]
MDDKKICVSTIKEKQKLPLPIIDIIKNSTKVEVGGKKVVLDQEIINNFIVISDKTMADVGILVENITKSPQSYAQYLKYFNIDVDNQTPGFYHKLIISLICLLEEKGKIIFLDRINNYIKKEDKLIVNQIINKIKTNNKVVIVGGENG